MANKAVIARGIACVYFGRHGRESLDSQGIPSDKPEKPQDMRGPQDMRSTSRLSATSTVLCAMLSAVILTAIAIKPVSGAEKSGPHQTALATQVGTLPTNQLSRTVFGQTGAALSGQTATALNDRMAGGENASIKFAEGASRDFSRPTSGAPQPQTYNQGPRPATYSNQQILQAGHNFFGSVSAGMAQAVERLFAKYGRPNGYILGEEAGGAIIAGLRYGEGVLHTQNAGQHRVYWQGPSVGWDFGAEGAKTMILVYGLNQAADIYRYYGGVDGSAYLIGGVGVTVMNHDPILITPMRAGVGARLGLNAGYMKITRKPTWNPF